MIRLMKNKGICAGYPEDLESISFSRRVTLTSILSVINLLEKYEDSADGVKRWIVVNGAVLTKEQLNIRPYAIDSFERAESLLAELALAASKRRASARQKRADSASGFSKPLNFGL
jgi:hypothetical protein